MCQVMRPVDLIHRTDSPGNVLKLTPQTIVLVLWQGSIWPWQGVGPESLAVCL